MPKISLYNINYKDVLLTKHVDLILTSPPYNIGSSSPKKITNRKNGGYDSKSWGSIEGYPDKLREEEYQQQQYDFLVWCANHLKDNGNIIYNHKLRHKNGRTIDPTTWFPKCLYEHDRIVWDRKSTHNHCKQFTYPQYEYLYCLRKVDTNNHYFCNQPPIWNNRNKGIGNVWRLGGDRQNTHNAPFPLQLARQVIQMWCPPNGVICDPYSGSGTVMCAAYMENRDFIGTEILPKYYKDSLERLNCIKINMTTTAIV